MPAEGQPHGKRSGQTVLTRILGAIPFKGTHQAKCTSHTNMACIKNSNNLLSTANQRKQSAHQHKPSLKHTSKHTHMHTQAHTRTLTHTHSHKHTHAHHLRADRMRLTCTDIAGSYSTTPSLAAGATCTTCAAGTTAYLGATMMAQCTSAFFSMLSSLPGATQLFQGWFLGCHISSCPVLRHSAF